MTFNKRFLTVFSDSRHFWFLHVYRICKKNVSSLQNNLDTLHLGHPNGFSLCAPRWLFTNVSRSRHFRICLLARPRPEVPLSKQGGCRGYAAQSGSGKVALSYS